MLIFATGFAPYSASENLVNSKLALAMLRRGWDVTVISARDEMPFYGTTWEDPWIPLQRVTHEVAYAVGGPARQFLERAVASCVMGHPVAGVRWAERAYRLALELDSDAPYDAVLSRSVSDVAHLPAMKFARKRRVPLIANWNDPPPYLFPAPYDLEVSAASRLAMARYFRSASRAAAVNTFPCRRLATYMSRHVLDPRARDRVCVIPHVGYAAQIPAAECPPANVFRVCHAGNLSEERSPRTFLEAFRHVAAACPPGVRAEFLVLGVDRIGMHDEARRMGIGDAVVVLGEVPYLRALALMAGSSALVLVEAPCEEGIFLPSKVVDYAEVRRPILAVSPAAGTMADLFRTKGGGLAVDCRSSESVRVGLTAILAAWHAGRADDLVGTDLAAMFAADGIVDEIRELIGRRGRDPRSSRQSQATS